MIIWISPYDILFDRDKAQITTGIDEPTSLFTTHYEIDPAGRLHFVDKIGNDVVIFSQLSTKRTLSLISQLEQVGYTGTTNPWEANCH